jgi:CBS domain-containing protein
MQLRDIMTRNIKTIASGDSVHQAAVLMRDLDIGILPLSDQQRAGYREAMARLEGKGDALRMVDRIDAYLDEAYDGGTVHFWMTESLLEAYRALELDPDAEKRIHVSPKLYLMWTDEHPTATGTPNELRRLDARSCMSANLLSEVRQDWWDTGEIPERYRVFWAEAREQIPDWPGFKRLGRFKRWRQICEETLQAEIDDIEEQEARQDDND